MTGFGKSASGVRTCVEPAPNSRIWPLSLRSANSAPPIAQTWPANSGETMQRASRLHSRQGLKDSGRVVDGASRKNG